MLFHLLFLPPCHSQGGLLDTCSITLSNNVSLSQATPLQLPPNSSHHSQHTNPCYSSKRQQFHPTSSSTPILKNKQHHHRHSTQLHAPGWWYLVPLQRLFRPYSKYDTINKYLLTDNPEHCLQRPTLRPQPPRRQLPRSIRPHGRRHGAENVRGQGYGSARSYVLGCRPPDPHLQLYVSPSPSPRPNAIDKRPLPPQPTPSAPSTYPTRPPPAPTPSPPPYSNPTPAPSSPSASKAPLPSAASPAGWAITVIWRSEWRPTGPVFTASDRARARRGLRVATSSTPCPLRGSRSGSVPWTTCWRMWWCRGSGRRGERGKGGAGAALYVGFSSSSSSSCLRGFMVAVWDIERPWRRKGWRRIDRPSTPFPRPTCAISTSSGPRPAPWRPCAFPRARRAWRLGMVSWHFIFSFFFFFLPVAILLSPYPSTEQLLHVLDYSPYLPTLVWVLAIY